MKSERSTYTWVQAHRLTLWARALGLATIAHICLLDYDSLGWEAPRWIGAGCALILLGVRIPTSRFKPSLAPLFSSACFLLCLTKVYTLLVLRDVLTQSLLLGLYAGLCGVALLSPRAVRGALSAARGITALTYLLAALHKLNTDFLTQPTSCALHGVEVITQFALPSFQDWGLLASLKLSPLPIAIAVIGIEVILALLCWRRHPALWVLGALFHVPLTLTLAPAFGVIMSVGYVACTPSSIWRIFWSTLRGTSTPSLERSRHSLRSKYPLLIIGALFFIGTLVFLCLVRGPEETLGTLKGAGGALKVSLMILLSCLGARAWALRRRREIHIYTVPRLSTLAVTFCALYGVHGLSPYFGVEVQHSAAMLSNLRIDPQCHNSLIAPALARSPYLYIERIQFGTPANLSPIMSTRQRILRQEEIQGGLWNWAALNTMKRNWCIAENRPLALDLRWGDRSIHLPDLCREGSLEPLDAPWWLLKGWQRYQKNLDQSCHAPCVH